MEVSSLGLRENSKVNDCITKIHLHKSRYQPICFTKLSFLSMLF